jgi:WD40 repeat protein
MPLAIGSTLGSYEINDSLGAGGMGEVYRARDTRLGRRVAIKVLPDIFLSNPDRIARFEREAKMLASLNHPRVAALYSLDQVDGRHLLVMELVEGETLDQRLRGGPLPVKEALRIGAQIAEALEAAHDKGVVHRDLKPGNVKITADDEVKVLDFGLAKALDSPSQASNIANSPTLSMMATEAGLILGTAAYMSPEQAKGLPADHRSDVFSFGTVLYEMLTGRTPFRGETAPDIMASVLVRDPDLSALPPTLNPRIVELLKRCLEKSPKRRWQAAGDLRAEIETILATQPETGEVAAVGAQPQPLWQRAWPLVLVAALAVAATAVVTRRLLIASMASSANGTVTRFVVQPPEGRLFSSLGYQVVAISPTGDSIVYVSAGALFLRAMTSFESIQIQGVQGGRNVSVPTFSPDGRFLLFWSPDGVIRRIATVGGAPVTVCAAGAPQGMSWSTDGIVFGQQNGIMRLTEGGKQPELIVKTESTNMVYGPQLLPGGQQVLYSLSNGVGAEQWDRASIFVQPVNGTDRKLLIEGGSDARYLPSGHLVYALGGTLYAVRFDLSTLSVSGNPLPVLEGVQRSFAGATGAAQFSVSDNGSLAYIAGPPGTTQSAFDIALTDRKGAVEPFNLPKGPYAYPRISRDGRSVAYQTDEGKQAAVWIYNLRSKGAQRRLTLSGANRFPVWAPDSQRVAFQSDRDGDLGIFAQRVDGTGTAERLTKPEPNVEHLPESWSPDGTELLFSVRKVNQFSLWVLSLKDGKSRQISDGGSPAVPTAVFSPDGRWIAYSTSQSSTNDTTINVQPYPALNAKYQVYAPPGDNPHHAMWSPDMKEIFYIPRVGGFEAVSVATAPNFLFGNPIPVPRLFPAAPPTTPRTYDVAPDGRVISAVSAAGVTGQTAQGIHVVLNWASELSARVH